jgi:hypothetical protein
MDIPSNFKMYDDTQDHDDVLLKKNDIIFIDDDVCLIKTTIGPDIHHILFRLDNLEVLSKDFKFWHISMSD